MSFTINLIKKNLSLQLSNLNDKDWNKASNSQLFKTNTNINGNRLDSFNKSEFQISNWTTNNIGLKDERSFLEENINNYVIKNGSMVKNILKSKYDKDEKELHSFFKEETKSLSDSIGEYKNMDDHITITENSYIPLKLFKRKKNKKKEKIFKKIKKIKNFWEKQSKSFVQIYNIKLCKKN